MELRTKRLLLRPFRRDDLAAFSAFANDPAYRRFLGSNHPSAEQLVANNVGVDWKREHSWVIELNGAVCGSVFLGVDPDSGVGELACLLAQPFWGQRIAGEAGRAVVDYAFQNTGVAKVAGRAEVSHARSRRVMEKAGMVQEGTLSAERVDASGSRVDMAVYELTREAWAAARDRRPRS